MIETSDFRNGRHSPHRGGMDGSRLGGIFLERQVSPAGMIVVDVFAQDLSRVPIVEDDHVVEALAANASNDSFDVRALPWRARRRENLLDAESRDATFEVRPVDSIPVPQHEARRAIPRKGIDDLLRAPLSRGMFRDIEM